MIVSTQQCGVSGYGFKLEIHSCNRLAGHSWKLAQECWPKNSRNSSLAVCRSEHDICPWEMENQGGSGVIFIRTFLSARKHRGTPMAWKFATWKASKNGGLQWWSFHWKVGLPWENEQSDTSKINFFGLDVWWFWHHDSKRSCPPWHFPRCHADAAYLVRDGLAATRLNRWIKMEVRSWNKNYKNWDWSMSLWHLWQSMAKDITKGGGKKCLESCSDWDS